MKYVGVCWYVALVVHSIKIPGTGNTIIGNRCAQTENRENRQGKKKACINVEKGFDRQVMYDALNKSNKIFIEKL